MDAILDNKLENAILLTNIGIDLQEQCLTGEKYICYLTDLFDQANRTIKKLKTTSKSSLQHAKKLITSIITNSNNYNGGNLKEECENLLEVVEKQLIDIEGNDLSKTRSLPDYRSLKCWDKHPRIRGKKYWAMNLPTLPEDAFSDCRPASNKLQKSASLSSLKNMRRVELYLQRASVSDDDDSSNCDDSKFGDSDDEINSPITSVEGEGKKE